MQGCEKTILQAQGLRPKALLMQSSNICYLDNLDEAQSSTILCAQRKTLVRQQTRDLGVSIVSGELAMIKNCEGSYVNQLSSHTEEVETTPAIGDQH